MLGQEAICRGSCLVVGAGGLGCPVIQYLAASGIGGLQLLTEGSLGIVDYDTLDLSNLQRQVIHPQANVGKNKAASAAEFVRNLNGDVQVKAWECLLDSDNALAILAHYQIVVDATDNVATRYLLNDACVLLGKPLVSGGALRMDGQVTVYNHNGGPCYRCIFPVPPPPESVSNCSDNGVLGAITGVIGSLQALEVLKLLVQQASSLSGKLLMLDGESAAFRSFKMRARRSDCPVCGDSPTITQLIDYVAFCGAGAHDKTLDLKILAPSDRITVSDFSTLLHADAPLVILDVRDAIQFDICSFEHSLHIPIGRLEKEVDRVVAEQKKRNSTAPHEVPVYAVCRLGNDSQLAVKILQTHGIGPAKDIVGGFKEWSLTIDPTFPVY
ncbi:hypothetical protein HDU91_005407 [Kappamyces sp. JEL0680]|nr:hypothetical protein HDU91_005407 [Kappamyces sp. JEL0680]